MKWPSSSTARWLPSGRGDEPHVLTTVASATRLSAARHCRISSRSELVPESTLKSDTATFELLVDIYLVRRRNIGRDLSAIARGFQERDAYFFKCPFNEMPTAPNRYQYLAGPSPIADSCCEVVQPPGRCSQSRNRFHFRS